jgi:hypothetical protein
VRAACSKHDGRVLAGGDDDVDAAAGAQPLDAHGDLRDRDAHALHRRHGRWRVVGGELLGEVEE